MHNINMKTDSIIVKFLYYIGVARQFVLKNLLINCYCLRACLLHIFHKIRVLYKSLIGNFWQSQVYTYKTTDGAKYLEVQSNE